MFVEHNGQQYPLDVFSVADLRERGVPQSAIDSSLRAAAYDRIDAAAGHARARFVSTGFLIEEEYRFARDEAKRWRAAGSPADDVPQAIIDGADYSDISNEQSAVEIEAQDTGYDQYLGQIRTPRLAGKKAVREASGDDIDAAADAAIAQLDAIQPPDPALGA